MVSEDYKFYLSLENTICTDYVSEKFFQRAGQWAIPIVFKRETHTFGIPQDSFIAVDDFADVKQLGLRLSQLLNTSSGQS